MNVLFIVPSLRRAGAETQIIDLVNALDSGSFRKHLLAFERDLSQLDRVHQPDVSFHHLQRRYKYDLGFIWKISKLIDKLGIDVIHCTMEFSLLVGFLARLRSNRKPALVTVIHTTLNRGFKEELQDRLIYRRLLRACAAVVFVCKSQAEHWMKKCPALADSSVVIYNGVDIEKFNPETFEQTARDFRIKQGIPDDAFVISCIAGFRPEKAHHLIVKGFAALPDFVWLVLAGDGELKPAIEKQVAEAGITNRVIFTGNLPDVRPLLAASDVSLLASIAVETFSISMLESMSMEVPMVASDIGGLKEAIFPDETGALFPPGNVSAMKSVLQNILESRKEILRMGRNARRKVINEFSVEVMAIQTSGLLNRIGNGRIQ